MTDRVLLGDRGNPDGLGLYISKAGFDVKTCSDEQMTLSSKLSGAQIRQQGFITLPVNTKTIDIVIPNLGFYPFIMCSISESGVGSTVSFSHLSLTQVRFFHTGYNGNNAVVTNYNTNAQRLIEYLVLSIPMI